MILTTRNALGESNLIAKTSDSLVRSSPIDASLKRFFKKSNSFSFSKTYIFGLILAVKKSDTVSN
jgi:hypothetical protein